jgi:hypothetical protein
MEVHACNSNTQEAEAGYPVSKIKQLKRKHSKKKQS